MLRYWARDLCRSWSKRIAALFIVLSMLLSDLATFAEPNGSSTDTQTLICGRAEHRHTDACYEDVLVCGLEETEPVRTYKTTFSPHTHSEACYDKEGNLACGIMENEYYHKHNDFCKDTDGNPICGLKFKKPHEHTEECFDADGNLICTTPILTHKHSAACYDDKGSLICGQWEIPSFSSTADNLIETPGHHHDAGCYERRLTCGQEEHVHSPACYATEEKTEPAENTDTVDEAAAEQPEEQTNTSEVTEQTEEAEKDAAEQQAQTDNQPENTDTNTTVDASGNDTLETIDATIDAGTESSAESTNVSTEETNNIGSNPENTEPEEKPVEEKPSEENFNEENAIEEKPIYETNGDVLIRYNGDETAVTVPDGIRKIDKKAFYNNKTITTVNLPDSVEVINSSAFAECSNLEKVILSNQSGLELIGPAAFKNDRKLDTSFAANVDRIVENAFAGIAQEETTEEEQTGEEEQTNTEEQNNTEEETRTEEQNKDEEQTNIEEQTREEAPTIEEDQTGEDNEPAEPEETEKTEESEDPENSEKTEESDNQKNQEKPEDPDELTIPAAMTIPSDKDAPYQVTVTIPADAGIPEGTELVVAEQAEPQMRLMKSTPKNTTPMKLLGGKSLTVQEQTAGEETYASIPSLTEWQEGAEAPDIILYKKILDISLVTADGEEIEPDPEAKITVSVNLPEIDDEQEVEVRHITDNGSELLESTNEAGTITFTTNSFSLFEFTSTAQKLSSWTSGLLENTFFGKTNTQETTHEEISVDNVTEGLSILEAFSVTKNSDLWMTLRQIQRLVLGKLESLTLYTVENGKLGSIVKDNITLSDILRFNLSDLSSFALVKDSGLRRKTQDLGKIILNGMMPKGATAEAQDVTEAYADIDFSSRLESDEKKEKNAPDSTDSKDSSRIENSQERGDLKTRNENKTDFSLLAAYDISILNGNEEYQPEEGNAITVEIQNDSIHSGMNLQLWHIKDDGTREQVKDFSLEDGKISFDATGFSVYALVYRIETYYVDAEGDTYRITVEYGDDAVLPEDVELSVSEADAGSYLNEAAEALKTQTDYLLYRKFLDISFVQKITDEETGEEQIRIIEPQAPVKVSVQLMDVTDGAEALQVIHFGKDGAEKLASEATEEARITFEADSFSVFGFGNVLQPLAATETEEASIEILGFSGEAQLTAKESPEMEEGLEVLSTFTLNNNGENTEGQAETETSPETETIQETDTEQETNSGTNGGTIPLWIKAELKAGTELSEMESVVLYAVNGEETAPLIESLTTGSQVARLEAVDVAIVKDTGYRHLNLVLDMDENGQAQAQGSADTATVSTESDPQNPAETTESETTEGQQTETTETTGTTETAGRVIILDGMMPREAGATAIDLTEAYADHEYVVEEEQTEETAEETPAETTEETEEETAPATEEDSTETTDPEEPAQELSTAAQEQPEEEGGNTPAEGENTTADEATQPEGNESGEVEENTEESTEETAETAEQQPTRITLAAYDITLSNNESEYQPDETHPITVEIRDDRITADGNIELWHIKDDGTEERVKEFTVEEGRVVFEANGFSAYAIVTGPDPVHQNDEDVASLEELAQNWNNPVKGGKGFYISYNNKSKYMSNKAKINGNNRVLEEVEQARPENCVWYFEKQDGTNNTESNRYYIYTYINDEKKYIHHTTTGNSNNVELSNTKTAFDLSEAFYLKHESENLWLQHSNGGGGIRFYTDKKNDTNSRFTFTYVASTTVDADPYGMNGKSYGLMFWNGGIAGKAMMASSSNANKLDAKALEVLVKEEDKNDKLFVPRDSDISIWQFHWKEDNQYLLSTSVDGAEKYLKFNASGLSLVESESEANYIRVEPGTGTHAGQIYLSAGNQTLSYSGKVENGFGVGVGSAGSEWLNLVEYSELTSEYLLTYTATKISVSDESLGNGSMIVVYTRQWNPNKMRYDFYAVDHDGTLVPCYESGDTIQWIGNRVNTMLWDFVEYYTEGTTDPNYYYELYNSYSQNFIAPQVTGGQILSSNPIGINLDGRKNGYFYTPIVAWDETFYAYTGLKADLDAKTIVSCPIEDADDFYFALLQNVQLDDDTTTVETVDNHVHGITMKIKDITDEGNTPSTVMNTILGSSAGGAVNTTVPNLLSTNIDPETGYPTISNTNQSLKKMYEGAYEVNHLFLAGTYNGSGYFTYDSTQNFATLRNENDVLVNDFTVYRELGSSDIKPGESMKHGQFLPFNSIKPGVFTITNPYNQYDALLKPLADSNPRKDEKLYNVEHDEQTINLHFVVELEASFVQTPSGHDNWGHDIIYEFTGDDDFWLYVDGELVIDLGGIHSALAGKVNFATGEVVVNGKNTNLRELFKNNYKKRNPNATNAEVNTFLAEYFDDGEQIFRDYTTHTMKIFYMERGGGASNLNMRFNLASVKEGHVELSKKLEGVEDTESMMAEFPYQIWYKKTEDSPEILLSKEGSPVDIKVYYKNTSTNVTYKPTFTVDGITYQSVFMLKPGEVADIEIPDNAIWYKIIECGLNTDVFHKVVEVGDETTDLTVEVNEGNETVTSGTLYSSSYMYPDNRLDYYIDYAMTKSRSRAAFVNRVNPDALRTLTIEKHLFDTDGTTELKFDGDEDRDTTVFGFRLYLASELDDGATLADKYIYHVLNPNGVYCKWDATNQRFVPLGEGKTDYTGFTVEEKQSVSFHTSMNGSISKIPASYIVQVRDLLVGTKYLVEERSNEIPDGYSLRDYKIYDDDEDVNPSKTIPARATLTEETVGADKDPKVVINNLKGFGIRIYKEWNDADYMKYRAPTYFAVFTGTDDNNLTLVNGTVRQLIQNNNTLYWYFNALNNIPFANYRVREVTLSVDNPSVDSDGVVTNYGTATLIADGGTLTIQGTQKGETGTSSQEYTVHYEQGTPTQEKPNIRVDKVTNSREGFVIRKEDWEGHGLGETTFTLKDANYTDGSGLLNATYTSYINPDDATDSKNGYVTTAFLRKGATYTLTETKAKTGYLGLQNPLTITVDSNGYVSVSSQTVDNDFYVISTDHKTLTVKNKPFTFTVAKKDKDTGVALAGAKFELHKEITVGGYTTFDFIPLTGYTQDILITDSYGVIPRLDETLPAGTYRLDEIFAPAGYVKWSTGLIFTVNDVGKITIGSRYPDGTELHEESKEVNNRIIYEYILSIPNSADSKWPSLTISKQVSGGMADYNKDFEFTITLPNVDENTSFDYSIGTETGRVTVDGNHQIKKNLKHGQSLEIARLPQNTQITVAEATGMYTTTWKKDNVTVAASNNAITFNLADNTVVEVTNDMPAVAPTKFSTRYIPFLLLLLFGLMLLIGGDMIVKRRKGDDPDAGGTVAVNHNPTVTGPSPTTGTYTGQPTDFATDPGSHVRWRNSVRVEESQTSQQGYIPQARRTDVSCPQAKLWMNGGGDVG